MSLDGALLSGLTFKIDKTSDWVVFQDIFVHRCYDKAIDLVFKGVLEQKFTCLDLGCNVGYFSLMLLDRLIREGLMQHQLHLVDGNGSCMQRCFDCFAEQPLVKTPVLLSHGLIGKREGKANFISDKLLHACSRVAEEGDPVPYFDLENVCNGGRISLIKCDIEGSELDLIENYEALLRRTQFFLVEWHWRDCDVAKAQVLLAKYGFHCRREDPKGAVSVALWENPKYAQ